MESKTSFRSIPLHFPTQGKVLSWRAFKEEDPDGKPDLSFAFDGCEPDTHRLFRRGSLACFRREHPQSSKQEFVLVQVSPGRVLRRNRNTTSGFGAAARDVI
jgi:hypothetical protein